MKDFRTAAIGVSAGVFALGGGVLAVLLLGLMLDICPTLDQFQKGHRGLFSLVFVSLLTAGMFFGIAVWVLLLRARISLDEMLHPMRNENYPIIPGMLERVVKWIYGVGRGGERLHGNDHAKHQDGPRRF